MARCQFFEDPEIISESEERTGKIISTFTTTESVLRSDTKNITSESGSTSDMLDLFSTQKAFRAISGEIRLEKLINEIMKLVIENAGAEKGYLILPKENIWSVEATASVKEKKIKRLKN